MAALGRLCMQLQLQLELMKIAAVQLCSSWSLLMRLDCSSSVCAVAHACK
jgi:hypothetical protein